jgi:hypothetical protein
VEVDPLSRIPILLEIGKDEKRLSTATGFFVADASRASYLITNWHVVSGLHPDTRLPLAVGGAHPDVLAIWLEVSSGNGWEPLRLKLRDDLGRPLWREHPNGTSIDVVALPVDVPTNLVVHPLDLATADLELQVGPSEPVSIIGFPFGLTSGGRMPIWKTGHIASDLAWDALGRPMFLIDATTKPAMSGSPVVAKRLSSYVSKPGTLVVGDNDVFRFLGVYSARHDEAADPSIGYVWKPHVVTEILTGGLPR